MQLITTKPTIYLINLTMKDYLRQKSKYLPPIATWVTTHGGLPRDIIPFSIEFEEKLYSLRNDPTALSTFLAESKVKSKLEKIITKGPHLFPFSSPSSRYLTDAQTRLHQARPPILLHRRREGDPLLDDPQGLPCTTSRRRHPL